MMGAPDWHRVKSVIESALEREPAKRAAFVQRVCRDDIVLRREVESVLDAMDRAGSFAEGPAIQGFAFSDPGGTDAVAGRRTLQPGDVLGPHEILDFLGAGGMGEVYRARDSRLHREVALKVLPETFASDFDRLARFRREAQVLASLNHPNIAAIYGLEDSDNGQALVLELVDGPTLAHRIASGPIPFREAVSIAKQIADGLTAAHRAGVVHRDLKPANIKLRPDGTVKILDFGLAKALLATDAKSGASASASIMGGSSMSQEGVLVGTAAYMSPEQALGRTVDEHSDIWAFGCVVYEMITGRRAFQGETARDTLAAVLLQEPDWRAVPADTPPVLLGVLRRCLEKNVERRMSDLAEIGGDIERAGAARRVAAVLGRHYAALPVAVVSAVLVGAAAMVWMRPSAPRPAAASTTTRLMIGLPTSAPLALAASMPLGLGQQSIAIAPDGTHVVYVLERQSVRQLYRRSLDQFDAVPIPNTEGAFGPFFSPDGRWLAFFANNKLSKVPVSGGNPIPLCDAPNPYGGTWGADGTIMFSSDEGRRPTRVHEARGGCERIVVGNDRGSWRHPDLLPGGRAAIVSNPLLGVGVLSIETGDFSVLVQGASGGRYAPSGHLVFARSSAMLAAPIDLKRLALTGPEAVVVDGVHTDAVTRTPLAVFSRTGTLVYAPARSDDGLTRPVWVNRGGTVEPLGMPPRQYRSFSLSPDGRRIAIAIADVSTDIWVYDLARDTLTRLTSGGHNVNPTWTTDATRVVFSERSDGGATPFWAPADGSRPPEPLFASDHRGGVTSFSPTDDLVIFQTRGRDTGLDLWVRPLRGHSPPQPFLRTRFTEVGPQFSPDGRWIAYGSDESGQYEIYVRPYPGPGGKWQVSTDGGVHLVWSRDGKELFYRNGQKWMSVAVTLGRQFAAEKPRLLFEGPYVMIGNQSYDVSPDGRRFLVLEPVKQEAVTHLNVVLNWFDEVNRKTARNSLIGTR